MQTHFIEATNGVANYGKFMLARFDPGEWLRPSALPGYEGGSMLAQRGWTDRHLWVCDLETGEGGFFLPGPGASPAADLAKHGLWVCVIFDAFLAWLYRQDLTELAALPAYVDLPDAPADWRGYRRPGPVWAPERPVDEQTLFEVTVSADGLVMADGHALADSFEAWRTHPAFAEKPLDVAAVEPVLSGWRQGGRHPVRLVEIDGTLARVRADRRELFCCQADDTVRVYYPPELLAPLRAAGMLPAGAPEHGTPHPVRAGVCARRELPVCLDDVTVLRRPLGRADMAGDHERAGGGVIEDTLNAGLAAEPSWVEKRPEWLRLPPAWSRPPESPRGQVTLKLEPTPAGMDGRVLDITRMPGPLRVTLLDAVTGKPAAHWYGNPETGLIERHLGNWMSALDVPSVTLRLRLSARVTGTRWEPRRTMMLTRVADAHEKLDVIVRAWDFGWAEQPLAARAGVEFQDPGRDPGRAVGVAYVRA